MQSMQKIYDCNNANNIYKIFVILCEVDHVTSIIYDFYHVYILSSFFVIILATLKVIYYCLHIQSNLDLTD